MAALLAPFQPLEVSHSKKSVSAPFPVVLSFDVEEHHRIEAASGLEISQEMKNHYTDRVEPSTRWILEALGEHQAKATFFIVGEYAEKHPDLVKEIHSAGHEIASHGWDHRRVLAMTQSEFKRDLRQSKDVLEQLIGEPVFGYRAPTFSIMKQTAWAIDILAEAGFTYDSSIYPVHHDRYGVASAPRSPFIAKGFQHQILELPPATLRLFANNAPMGGGGYFRLFPLFMTQWAIAQMKSYCDPAVPMLYFHPWEFDAEQEKLPLRMLNRIRTYIGIKRNRERLCTLIEKHQFSRAIDIVRALDEQQFILPVFDLAPQNDYFIPLPSMAIAGD